MVLHLRAGYNKRAGWKKGQKILNEQALIRASRLEKTDFFFVGEHARVIEIPEYSNERTD